MVYSYNWFVEDVHKRAQNLASTDAALKFIASLNFLNNWLDMEPTTNLVTKHSMDDITICTESTDKNL